MSYKHKNGVKNRKKLKIIMVKKLEFIGLFCCFMYIKRIYKKLREKIDEKMLTYPLVTFILLSLRENQST